MAKRILIPLDGSITAETALSLIGDLARGAGAAVKLLHVAPIPDNQYGNDGYLIAYADQEIARLEAENLDYLATVEVQLANARPSEPCVRSFSITPTGGRRGRGLWRGRHACGASAPGTGCRAPSKSATLRRLRRHP